MNLPHFKNTDMAMRSFISMAFSIGSPVGIKTSMGSYCSDARLNNQGPEAAGESLAMGCTIGKNYESATISCYLLERD